ncbi:MAG: DUF3078 domain-containing protein [Bacteroidales bacterium]|nr:DUF3078 domain-containing protein [Bacteroidales bacterium]
MKRLLLAVCAIFTTFALFAQAAPAADSAAAAKPKAEWKKGISTTIGFSQLSLTNWAAGGAGQLTLNTFADFYADMTKGRFLWANELQAGYGFIQSFDTGYKKSDDRLIFDSKFGYKAAEKLYLSTVFNFRTQFARGFTNDEVVSNIFAPAYVTLGLGIDYTPVKNVSINFAPVTGKVTMVNEPELRYRYGNAYDQFARFELGAQLKIDAKLEVENFKVGTTVVVFSDYFNKPQNLKINWDVNAEAKISKFFSVTLRTNMIYDDNILLNKTKYLPNGDILEYQAAGVQFKELFTIGFSYTFGQKKK